jgi:hypothetical protein
MELTLRQVLEGVDIMGSRSGYRCDAKQRCEGN